MSNKKKANKIVERKNIGKFDKDHPYMQGYYQGYHWLSLAFQSNTHRALSRVEVEASNENHQ
jgi:hypothetical protein